MAPDSPAGGWPGGGGAARRACPPRGPGGSPAARDHVVLPADEPEVAVGVLPAEVAGQRPVADELLARRRLVVPVAQEHDGVRAPDGDLADLSRGQRAAPGV